MSRKLAHEQHAPRAHWEAATVAELGQMAFRSGVPLWALLSRLEGAERGA